MAMTYSLFLLWSQRCVAYANLSYKIEPFGQQVALRAVDRSYNFYACPDTWAPHYRGGLDCSSTHCAAKAAQTAGDEQFQGKLESSMYQTAFKYLA